MIAKIKVLTLGILCFAMLQANLANAGTTWHTHINQATFWNNVECTSENTSDSPCTDDRAVTVGLIDTGIDLYHPELETVLWRNPGETSATDNYSYITVDECGVGVTCETTIASYLNGDGWTPIEGADGTPDWEQDGIDNDNNGYADDIHGINPAAVREFFQLAFGHRGNDYVEAQFRQAQASPMDYEGHGTSVAGVVDRIMNFDHEGTEQSRRENPRAKIIACRNWMPMSSALLHPGFQEWSDELSDWIYDNLVPVKIPLPLDDYEIKKMLIETLIGGLDGGGVGTSGLPLSDASLACYEYFENLKRNQGVDIKVVGTTTPGSPATFSVPIPEGMKVRVGDVPITLPISGSFDNIPFPQFFTQEKESHRQSLLRLADLDIVIPVSAGNFAYSFDTNESTGSSNNLWAVAESAANNACREFETEQCRQSETMCLEVAPHCSTERGECIDTADDDLDVCLNNCSDLEGEAQAICEAACDKQQISDYSACESVEGSCCSFACNSSSLPAKDRCNNAIDSVLNNDENPIALVIPDDYVAPWPNISAFPGGWNFPHVIYAAGSNTSRGLITSFNFGPHSISIAAPGRGVTTLELGGRINQGFGGTSAASPMLVGSLAAIAWANPDLSMMQVRNLLFSSANPWEELPADAKEDVIAGGTADIGRVVNCRIDPTANERTLTARTLPTPLNRVHFQEWQPVALEAISIHCAEAVTPEVAIVEEITPGAVAVPQEVPLFDDGCQGSTNAPCNGSGDILANDGNFRGVWLPESLDGQTGSQWKHYYRVNVGAEPVEVSTGWREFNVANFSWWMFDFTLTWIGIDSILPADNQVSVYRDYKLIRPYFSLLGFSIYPHNPDADYHGCLTRDGVQDCTSQRKPLAASEVWE